MAGVRPMGKVLIGAVIAPSPCCPFALVQCSVTKPYRMADVHLVLTITRHSIASNKGICASNHMHLFLFV